MDAIAEHTEAILTRDVAEEGLQRGDVGTVVSVQYGQDGKPAGYTLEIFSITGQSLGTANVEATALREASGEDITHARPASA